MRDRLIELYKKIEKEPAITCPAYKTDKTCKDCQYSINDSLCNHIERQVDYLLANGVVALPYEEGQLVYVLKSKTLNGKNLYLKKEIISHYRIFKDRAYMFFKSGGLSVCDNLWKETVFLTEEEAERALKGGE